MNRHILFRGRTYTSDWVYGFYYQDHRDIVDFPEIADSIITFNGLKWIVDPNTVGQLSPFEENDGGPIYEGDIVGIGADVITVCKVDQYGRFMLEHQMGRCWKDPILLGCYPLTVRGNIYETPNLLSNENDQV